MNDKAWSLSFVISLFIHGALIGCFFSALSKPLPFLLPPPLLLHLNPVPDEPAYSPEFSQTLGSLVEQSVVPKRTKTLSHAPKGTPLETYLAQWEKQIEKVGNQYYLSSHQRSKHEGELRLLVSLDKNGRLSECIIRKSSGNPVLDTLAKHIVQKAAPFGPLPTEVLEHTDQLEIVRTWSFRGGLNVHENG